MKRISKIVTLLVLVLWIVAPLGRIQAQNLASKPVTMNLKSVTVKEFFDEVKKQTGLSFMYNADLAKSWPKVTVKADKKPAKQVIEEVLSQIDCNYFIRGNIVSVDKRKERIVEGQVVDNTGEPLVGAPVSIGGGRVGTVTDATGHYSLTIPVEKTVLKISYVGMENVFETIPAGTEDITRKITMQSGTQLDDVVVIGYGSMKRKDLTGSVTTVNPNELVNAPAVTIDDALSGKAAGVMVTKADGSPGGAVRIRIRGGASLQGGVDPLYIIDGIPMEIKNNYISTVDVNNPLEWDTNGEKDMGAVSGNFMRGLNSLAGLNINDIETITIMKDASATAIYGSKAANGVVIITTKRGLRDQKPTFNFSYTLGISNPVKEKLLNGDQYMQALESSINTSNTNIQKNLDEGFLYQMDAETYMNDNNTLLNSVKGYVKQYGNANTDWLDLVLKTAVSHNVDFSVSGGGNASRYYTSFSYNKQEGTLIGTDFNRLTANLSMDNDITKRFRTYVKMNLSYTKNNINSGIYNQALYAPPILPAYNADGSFAEYSDVMALVHSSYGTLGYQNPLAVATSTNEAKTYGFNGSLSGEYDITQDLKFKSTLSLSYSNYNQLNYIPSYVLVTSTNGAADNGGGSGSQAQSTLLGTFWENTFTYNKVFNDKHALNAVIGHAWEQDKESYFSATGRGYPDDKYLNNLSSAAFASSVAGANPNAKSSLLSFYGRLNYTLMERYLFTLTGRSDTSSKFSKDHRTGYFPSAAFAWRVSQEKFLRDIHWIDEIKLRASIGKTGTQNIGNWMFLSLFTPDSYGGHNALYSSQLGNDDIKWESTVQKDLGLDFSFFKGRLGGTIAYYQKVTDDALLAVTPAPSSGFSSVISNIAKISNKGLEVEIYGDYIRTNSFRWSGALNISHNESLVEKILDNQFSSATDRNAFFYGTSLIREGESLGLLCGYKMKGLVSNKEEMNAYREAFSMWPYFFPDMDLGTPVYELDEDGWYYQDVIGNCTPDFYGGYTNTISYKNWSLIAAFTFSYGNDLLYQKDVTDQSFNSLNNRSTRVLEASSAGNFTGKLLSSFNSPMSLSSLNVYDASYLKLQTLSLAYDFPKTILSRLKMNSMQVYATASNVFTITSYPGPDPAVCDNPYSLSGGGRDVSSYPTVKSFSFGVRLGF